MLTLNDGRNELWQWDTGRKLEVDVDCSQVHFSNKVFGRSIDVDVVDGVATIPDILLQTDKELNVWAFAGTTENGYTKISKVFKVNRRNKPADYVFTPHEQTTLAEIMERIDDLEAIQDPDAIKNAVDDYLANNPVHVDEKDPTVPEWAKQPNPPDVKIPDKLPNPYSITFTGAVNASYDGSSAVEIKIPDSGGSTVSSEWVLVADVTTEGDDLREIKIDKDSDGNSFEFREIVAFFNGTTLKKDIYFSVTSSDSNRPNVKQDNRSMPVVFYANELFLMCGDNVNFARLAQKYAHHNEKISQVSITSKWWTSEFFTSGTTLKLYGRK